MANTPGARPFGILVFAIGLVAAGLAVREAVTSRAFDRDEAPPASPAPTPEPSIMIQPAPAGPSTVDIITRCTGGAAEAVPAGTNRAWITGKDYPRDALRHGREGLVAVDYVVGRDGRVADCRVTRSSNVADLDAASCDMLFRRATFIPARDANGCPAPSRRTHLFRWQIPRQ